MRILAVCGVGIGQSVLLKMNAEKALTRLGLEAEVSACSVAEARRIGSTVNIILTTKDLADILGDMPAEVIVIDFTFDINEIEAKLSKALL